jgi:pimeloyl-ACP methyl ester carboxylesterase
MIIGRVLAVIASTALSVTAPACAADAAGPAGWCRAVHIPVSLPADEVPTPAADQTVWAEFCVPSTPAPGRPVDVTVPGATYTHLYWDWPADPDLYNFTDKALRAGQTVLDYDRLGTGKSSSPPSADLTINTDAAVLHQVIAWVRASEVYTDVNLIGHSLGSAIAMEDAGTWPDDVSKLVLTGILNEATPAVAAAIAADFYPASSDPQFPDAGLGYLTTIPGVRGSLFYSPSASPAVIAYDEAHKSIVAKTEIDAVTSLTAPPGTNVADKIRAPVLIVDGEDDALFCTGSVNCANPASVAQFEKPYFSHAASLTVEIVPDTGHDVALHPTAGESFAMINAWLSRCHGPSGPQRAPSCFSTSDRAGAP